MGNLETTVSKAICPENHEIELSTYQFAIKIMEQNEDNSPPYVFCRDCRYGHKLENLKLW